MVFVNKALSLDPNVTRLKSAPGINKTEQHDPSKLDSDAEESDIYAMLAEQHKHPRGPWSLMVSRCKYLLSMAASGSDSNKNVLDLATGPGQPGISIAQALPSVFVHCTDISEDMVAKATASSVHLDNCKVSLANVEDLSQFENNSMDIVTCCYGFMFPENKLGALKEAYRVLKPGGNLVATTWDRMDTMDVFTELMTAVLGEKPLPSSTDPMSLSEPGFFTSLISEAGFIDLDVSTSTYPFNFGTDADFHYKVFTFLVRDELDELNAHDAAHEALSSIVPKYSHLDPDGSLVMTENTFKLTVATKKM